MKIKKGITLHFLKITNHSVLCNYSRVPLPLYFISLKSNTSLIKNNDKYMYNHKMENTGFFRNIFPLIHCMSIIYHFQNDANPNGNSLGIGNSGLSSMMLSLGNQQTSGTTPIVLKDRLLTDSVVFSEEFPSIVNGTTHGITATTTHNGTSRYFDISNTIK